jgi:hypothetical protein
MSVSNIYNQPGSQSIYFTLANNTAVTMQDDLGKCKIGVESDTGNLCYTDALGVYHSIPAAAIAILLSGALPIGINFQLQQIGGNQLWACYSATGSAPWTPVSQVA